MSPSKMVGVYGGGGLGVVCGSVGPFGDLNKFDVTLVVSLRSEMMSVGRVLSLLIVFRLGWPFGGPTNVQLQVLLFFPYEELQVVGGGPSYCLWFF